MAEEQLNELNENEAPAKEGETKAEKFLRLAPPRVNKILNGIGSLKKLSAHSSYEYSDEQISKMFTALRSAIDDCEEAFKPKEKESSGFTF